METQKNEELQKEIQELKNQAKKQFMTGMAIMVGSLLVILVCALTSSFVLPHYQDSSLQSKLESVVQISWYVFYLGLFFIIRYHITRRKIPKDGGIE